MAYLRLNAGAVFPGGTRFGPELAFELAQRAILIKRPMITT